MATQLLFLPGAMGVPDFWAPLAARLDWRGPQTLLGWPGFGATAPDPRVTGIDDLVASVAARIDQPTALVAQSMGGVIAIRAALARPGMVTHLVLAATSGGIDMRAHGAEDWRPAFERANPHLPRWFSMAQEDLSPALCALDVPTLLLWGDADVISPVSVGQALAELVPRSRLHVVAGGDHGFARERAGEIAPLVRQHLASGQNL